MDKNDINIPRVSRKIYSRDFLKSLQTSELSILWPKCFDKKCTNIDNQWDPVKSFELSKNSLDVNRTVFSENKNKIKDDISLRPERRQWNDGCQVTNRKKMTEDNLNSNRKSCQSVGSNQFRSDYDKNRYNRNPNRNSVGKIKHNEKLHNYINNTNKLEKYNLNSLELEDKIEEKKEQKVLSKVNHNSQLNNQILEPEWFLKGPNNCTETIELRGIGDNDYEILSLNSMKPCEITNIQSKEGGVNLSNIINENSILKFPMDKPLNEKCMSPKREGSRFQDIFLKEKQLSQLNESNDLENVLKPVLSDNVSTNDAERLKNLSKSLIYGVLTLEEIEKNMISVPTKKDDVILKSAKMEASNSFESNLNSLLSSGLSNSNQDNSKVVNWLSGLNLNVKETEIENKLSYNDSFNFRNPNSMINSTSRLPINYAKFISTSQAPPGLPLMLNNNQFTFHQSQLMQQYQQNQLIQQNKFLHSAALMKYLQTFQINNINNFQSNNLLSNMFHQNNQINDVNVFMCDQNKLNSPSNNQNETCLNQKLLSNYILKKPVQINHINQELKPILSTSSPPGLMNINLVEENMVMHPRPIVKTVNNPQILDLTNEFNKHFSHNFGNNRNISINNPTVPMQSCELMNRSAVQMYNSARNRELLQKQSIYFKNLSNRPSFMPQGAHEMNIENSSKILAKIFNVSPSTLPPLPQEAKYSDQIETDNI